MAYSELKRKLAAGEIIILDGGTGTELERRGVPMDSKAWCGPTSLEHLDVLEAIHRDYIAAGADIIIANTYASSPLMLEPAGFGNQFEKINRAAIRTAHQAREASGRRDVTIAGSLSHMVPVIPGTDRPVSETGLSQADVFKALRRLASLHKEEGSDLILLEMMYHPERMKPAFDAAFETGLPVWAGFSVRRGDNGEVLAFTPHEDIPFEETVKILADYDVAAAGIMHAPSNVIADAISILREAYRGPLLAYPDSGYFKMPKWQFDAIIPPDEFRTYADRWAASGVQVIGGCCGLSPDHIRAIAPIKTAASSNH